MLENTDDYSKKWLVFIGMAFLMFGCYLDYTVVNIALPTIQQELQANLVSLQWVMNIYFLALCVLATAMGRLGDLYGRRRFFYIGASIFAIASIIAGFASHIHLLILGRFLQGVGAAIVFPLGMSLVPHSFPQAERGKAIGMIGSIGGMALALGPVLGGFIVTHWGWRWIFFINIPISLLGFIFCSISLKESHADHDQASLDLKGMFLLALSVGGIVLSLISSQQVGWENPVTLIYLFVGILAGIFLVKVEKNQSNPLVDFQDFANPLFLAGAVLCFLAGVLSAVTLFFDPLYLQIIKSQSPQISGLVLFAIPLAVFLMSFLVSPLISGLGIINTIMFGLVLAVISAILQIFFDANTSLTFIIAAFLCMGSMWALGNTVAIFAAQTAVGPKRMSAATGTIVTMFNIGGSVALAVAVVLYDFVTSRSLERTFENLSDTSQWSYLKKLLANPAKSLQVSMDNHLQSIFDQIFIAGFTGVMWFLAVASLLGLSIVWIAKKNNGKNI